MSILSKPIGTITKADLEALVDARARETNELEFKGDLPFKPIKNQPEKADRWIEKGDGVGNLARDEILAEVVAFANAEGGTLILGLHEAGTNDEPRVADHLQALPRCEALLKRLLDAAESTIEPRLVNLDGQAIPEDATGAGFIVLRAGKSIRGPHRLQGTREFYIRRGERAAKMDVREIKDLTLELARSGDRLEQAFVERQTSVDPRWVTTERQFVGGNKGPFLIRVTALPTVQTQIPDLTKRRDYWWSGEGFSITLNDKEKRSTYPSDTFNGYPKPRLRAFEMLTDEQDPQRLQRVLRGDGLVEFMLMHAGYKSQRDEVFGTDIYFGSIAQMAVGALCQIEHLRRKIDQDSLSYALEVEIRSREGSRVFLHDEKESSNFGQNNQPGAVILPRLEVGGRGDFNSILNLLLLDISNAWGQHWDLPVSAPWDRLLRALP